MTSPEVLIESRVLAIVPDRCHNPRCGMPILCGDIVMVRRLRDHRRLTGERTEILCENCQCGWKEP